MLVNSNFYDLKSYSVDLFNLPLPRDLNLNLPVNDSLGFNADVSSDLLKPILINNNNNNITSVFSRDDITSVFSRDNIDLIFPRTKGLTPRCDSLFKVSKTNVDNSLLKRVENGSIVLFSHINKFTHLTIKESQKLLNKGWHDFFNITHAGIVVDSSDEHIEVSEIPGMGKQLSQNSYSLRDLPVGDNLLFISGVHKNLIKRVAELAKLWTAGEINENSENQYNLKDIILQPFQTFSGHKMDLDSKMRLVEAFIDTFVHNQQPLDFKENYATKRQFFCSEFVIEVFQMAWLEKHASLPQEITEIKKQLSLSNLDSETRKTIAEEILIHWNKTGVWSDLATSKVIGSPAKGSSPSSLITEASKMGKLITIEGTAKRNLDNYAEHAEYSLTRALDLYLSGKEMDADHPDVIVGLNFLENRLQISQQTFSCLNQKSEDISKCVTQSMTWYEKFGTYLMTREINRILKQLVKEDVFDKIAKDTVSKINQSVPNFSEIKDSAINELLPTDSLDLTSLENYITHYVLENASPEIATKYTLLAVLSDFSKDSILEQLKDLINHKNFSLVRLHKELCSKDMKLNEAICDKNSALYVQIAEIVIKRIIKDIRLQSMGSPAFEAIFRDVVKDLHDSQEMENLLTPLETNLGYSQNTLRCFMKDFDAKGCLETTLTTSEKLGVLMASYRSNEALNNFVDSPIAKMLISKEGVNEEFIDQIEAEIKNNPDGFFLDLFFPLNVDGYVQWITNHLYRYQIENLTPNERKHQIFKYIPLGLHYKKPTEKVRNFVEKFGEMPSNPVLAEKLPFLKAMIPLISLYNSEINMESLLNTYEELKQFI